MGRFVVQVGTSSDRPQLVVEFFCPDGPDRPAGNLYRPRRDTSPTAKQNLGGGNCLPSL